MLSWILKLTRVIVGYIHNIWWSTKLHGRNKKKKKS